MLVMNKNIKLREEFICCFSDNHYFNSSNYHYESIEKNSNSIKF